MSEEEKEKQAEQPEKARKQEGEQGESSPEAAESASAAEEKPKKKVPQVPKGKFKKQEATDLAAMKGKFAKPKEGPVQKQSIERFAKRGGPNKKVMLAVVVVIVVLVGLYFVLGSGSGLKHHPVYLKATNAIRYNEGLMKRLGGTASDLKGGMPSVREGTEDGRKTVEVTGTISGAEKSGEFKAKAAMYKAKWHMLYLEVTIDGEKEILLHKEITDRGIQNVDAPGKVEERK